MRSDLLTSKSIEINATPSKVWNVLTNPEIIKEYLYDTETITDWKVGSEIIFQGDYSEQKYRDMGVILENSLYELLSYSYWSNFTGLQNKPENYSLITYSLEMLDNMKTKFTWEQKGYVDEQSCANAESGIEALVEKIKEIAER